MVAGTAVPAQALVIKEKNMKIGVLTVLGCIFVTLKLCGIIAWSWWWVLLPFYFGMAVLVGVFVVGITGIFCVAGFSALLDKIIGK